MTVLVTIAWWHGVPPDLLDRAVRSVLAQTYTDLQLVVIGDGENPALDVSDDRLEVFVLPENRGPYFCQSVAIAASPHEWYATIGADDWVEPEHLETLLSVRASAVLPAYVWNDDNREQAWPGETGIVTTERLRAIGGYNPAERIGQDSLTWRLLREYGIAKTRKATYHRVRRPGSLTTSPETGIGSPLRTEVRARNREIFRACRGKPAEWVREYREGLVPADIAAEVREQAERLAAVMRVEVAA